MINLREIFSFQVFTDRNFILGRLRNSEHDGSSSRTQSPGALYCHCHDRISYSWFYHPAIAVLCLRSEESCEIHLWNSTSHGHSSWNGFKVIIQVFTNQTKFAIILILASDTLLHANKKISNKILVEIELRPLITSDSKSNTPFSTLTWHLLVILIL